MKTLILYATKYGAAEEIAGVIAGQIDDAVLHNLKLQPIPPLEDYDCIIIGSSIYAGSARKELGKFILDNMGTLRAIIDGEQKKKIGLFVSGMSQEGGEGVFFRNFTEPLVSAAKATAVLGGIFDPQKANFFEKLIMKIVTKQTGYVNNIDNEKINAFVAAMKE